MTATQDKQWGSKEARKLVWLAMLMDESRPVLTAEESKAMDSLPFLQWPKNLQDKTEQYNAAMIE